MKPYVVAVAGPSGSGKTRLIERLIPLLRKRGLRVGVVKHAHDRIDLDRPGKDSWRLLKAGAEAAAVVGPKQLLLVARRETADGLEQALGNLSAELDLILLEGFHRTSHPQIAVADRAGRVRRAPHAIAIVSDRSVRTSARWFRPRESRELAQFIEGEWTKRWETSYHRVSQGSSSQAV